MPGDTYVLENMKTNSTFQVDGFNAANTQLDKQLAEVNEQITALENFMHTKAKQIYDNSVLPETGYLVQKRDDFFSGELIQTGPDFNDITKRNTGAIDWKIVDSTTFIDIFVYHGVGWDSGGTIEAEIEVAISKWQWCYDYLNQDPGLSGTYGLYAKRDSLNAGKTVNTANKTQIEQTNTMLT